MSQILPKTGAPTRIESTTPRGLAVGWWTRPTAFLERCRARYGKRFTIRLLGTPPFVMLSDPDEIKQIFTAPPEVLHPGEGARILEPVVGAQLGDPARRGRRTSSSAS